MAAGDNLHPAQFQVSHEFNEQGGRAVAQRSDGSEIGAMHYGFREIKGQRAVHVDMVQTGTTSRRQGVASRMYTEVHAIHQVPFAHAKSEMSPAGVKTVRSLAKKNPDQHRVIARDANGNATMRKMR